MTRAVEKTMKQKLREYKKQGKSADWFKSWQRGWMAAGRSGQ